MTDRPILGVDKPESQPQKANPQAAQTTTGRQDDLPLAKELPVWDLLPSDTLLVRRRPAKP